MKDLVQFIFEDEALRSTIIDAVNSMDDDELKWLASQITTNPETIKDVANIIAQRTGVDSDADIIIQASAKRNTSCLLELKDILLSGKSLTYKDLQDGQNTTLYSLLSRKYPDIPKSFFEYIFSLNLMGKNAARGSGEILISLFAEQGTPQSGHHGDVLVSGEWIEVKDCSKRDKNDKGINGAIIAGNSNELLSTFWKTLLGHSFGSAPAQTSSALAIFFGCEMEKQSDQAIMQRFIDALAAWADSKSVGKANLTGTALMKEWVRLTKELADERKSLESKSIKQTDNILAWKRCMTLACLAVYRHMEGFDSFMVIGGNTKYLLLGSDELGADELFKNESLTVHSVASATDKRVKGPRIDVVGLNMVQSDDE